MESRSFGAQSSNHLLTASPAPPQTSAKKRRASATAGSRGVANLTPEQLAKKRANDREAQRAIRERTKGQIETLERKIQELTNKKPYEELQHVMREKELVEAENEEIKRRLNSVLSIIKPLVGSGIGEHVQHPYSDYRSQASLYSPDIHPPQLLSAAPFTPTYSDHHNLCHTASTSSTYGQSPQGPQQASPSSTQPTFTSQASGYSPVDAFGRLQSNPIHARPLRSEEKLDAGYVLQSESNRSGHQSYGREIHPPLILPMHTVSPVESAIGSEKPSNVLHAYEVPVKNTPPTCPLDGLLLDFLADRRQQAAEGVSTQELIGPAYPSFLSLIDPQRKRSHPLSKVVTDLVLTFPDIANLPEQVAILYIMFLIMRWQILPTQESFDRLPHWVTPRPDQMFTPHPAWIDHLPWPHMRDKLVRIYPSLPFDEFFIPFTTTISLNWPYDPRDVLVSTPGTDELSISPAFERHLRDLNNWSLGPMFANTHPSLADTTKIKP